MGKKAKILPLAFLFCNHHHVTSNTESSQTVSGLVSFRRNIIDDRPLRATPYTIQDKFLVGYLGWFVSDRSSAQCYRHSHPSTGTPVPAMANPSFQVTQPSAQAVSIHPDLCLTQVITGGPVGSAARCPSGEDPTLICGQMCQTTQNPNSSLYRVSLSRTETVHCCFRPEFLRPCKGKVQIPVLSPLCV